MKLQTLYLLLACVAMLGGCSRCKDDPEPAHIKQGIYLRWATYLPEYITAFYKLPVYDTGSIAYTKQGSFQEFCPSDTTYDEYVYTFGNGQQVVGHKYVTLYFADTSLTDSVRLKCWDHGKKDTIYAKRIFKIAPYRKWPHIGKYRGTLNYKGRIVENAVVTIFSETDSVYDGKRSIMRSSGILQQGCDFNLNLDFVPWPSYGTARGLLSYSDRNPTLLYTKTPPCVENYNAAISVANQLYLFPTQDSLIFFMNGIPFPTLQDHNNPAINVTFKGERI